MEKYFHVVALGNKNGAIVITRFITVSGENAQWLPLGMATLALRKEEKNNTFIIVDWKELPRDQYREVLETEGSGTAPIKLLIHS